MTGVQKITENVKKYFPFYLLGLGLVTFGIAFILVSGKNTPSGEKAKTVSELSDPNQVTGVLDAQTEATEEPAQTGTTLPTKKPVTYTSTPKPTSTPSVTPSVTPQPDTSTPTPSPKPSGTATPTQVISSTPTTTPTESPTPTP